jgi:hypothetical protein
MVTDFFDDSGFTPDKPSYQQNKPKFNKFKSKDEPYDGVYQAYAILLNKGVPDNELDYIKSLIPKLSKDYILRTSGLEPNELFYNLADKKELYLPWRDFNNLQSKFTWTDDKALEICSIFSPTFKDIKDSVKKIIATSVRVILGNTLKSRVTFFITYSEDGCESVKNKSFKTGNVGLPIALASTIKIPVFNLGNPESKAKLERYLGLSNE